MTWFDLLLLVVFALSISFAAIRGALREVATLIALVAAALLALVLVNPLLSAIGMAGSFFGTIIVAALVVVVLFGALYFALHMGLKRVALEPQMVRADRIAGGVFGFARAIVLIGLGFLGYGYYMDEARRPDVVKNAFLLPVAEASANIFEGLGPDLDAEPPAIAETDPENAAAEGYVRGDRAALDEIVTTVTTTDDQAGEETTPLESDAEDPIADILIEEDDSDE